jgi:predicted site-specific integrase-resolvase
MTKLYGLAELAEATGVPLGTLRQWRSRGKLPAPTCTLKAGQFWQGREIDEWLSRTNRTDKEA